MKKGLNSAQLKMIAILAMFCDHIAWGFVDMFTVAGQVMHTIGRFTLPIMCFFIAEGFRKTKNVRRYVSRMTFFAILTIIPFYLFFGEEYGIRQNIIFDLLLALLTLCVTANPDFSKIKKAFLVTVLVTTSAIIGGWVILPIVYVLIFYYKKTFKEQFLWIAGSTVLCEITSITMILLNNVYHFSHYDWKWYQWLYFLGFILPLPLLKQYNGERGTYPFGRHFFYLVYPGHFLVLYTAKHLLAGNLFTLYFMLHILCLIASVAITIRLITARPSRALCATMLLCFSSIIYTFGFILEIMTLSVDLSFAGTIMEYLGECIVFTGFLFFMAEFCHRFIPPWIYLLSGFFSASTVFMLLTTQETKLFYTDISINYDGPFPRLQLSYGMGFYLFMGYMICICLYCFVIGFKALFKSKGIERKRIRLVLIGIACPWIVSILRYLGLTGGYEISVVGILASLTCVYVAFLKYGYFDSVQLAGENALHHFGEAILVVDNDYHVLYYNKSMELLFPQLHRDLNVKTLPAVAPLVTGEIKNFTLADSIFDVDITPLEEQGFTQGYMLCAKDMTEHYHHLQEAERFAHTDPLTGLSNRAYYKTCFQEFRKDGGTGCMLMFDLDNFKGVNDNYGHSAGDKVLITLAETLLGKQDEKHLCCRIGGDEFCMFLKDITNPEEVGTICTALIEDFPVRLEQAGLKGVTSISIGAAILSGKLATNEEDDFKTVYKNADTALYIVKRNQKGTYQIYE